MNKTINAAVLDGYTLNPGDLDWQPLQALASSLNIYDRTTAALVLERSQGAQALFTNKVQLTGDLISALPELSYIGVLATGYNVVDIDAAHERGITVTNIPDYGTNSVAQFVFAQLLALMQPVHRYGESTRNQQWAKQPDFCYYHHSMTELSSLTIGVIGYGSIGQQVAALASAFGMQVLVYSRTLKTDLPKGIRWVELNELCASSDVISLHCPLTNENTRLIGTDFLQQMKPSAYLINTARGPLIDEVALAEALKSGTIKGAALDVLSVEPPPENHPLTLLDNCLVTPHIAWATSQARQRLMNTAADNFRQFLTGSPINCV